MIDQILTEYLRFLYAAPYITALFTAAFLMILAKSLIDITFHFAKKIIDGR